LIFSHHDKKVANKLYDFERFFGIIQTMHIDLPIQKTGYCPNRADLQKTWLDLFTTGAEKTDFPLRLAHRIIPDLGFLFPATGKDITPWKNASNI
jgi:hypothetical protein